MSAADMPPAMFDLEPLPPWEDPIARHNLAPMTDEFRRYYCAALLYAGIARGWVNHVCIDRPGHHNAHHCGNCEVTW